MCSWNSGTWYLATSVLHLLRWEMRSLKAWWSLESSFRGSRNSVVFISPKVLHLAPRSAIFNTAEMLSGDINAFPLLLSFACALYSSIAKLDSAVTSSLPFSTSSNTVFFPLVAFPLAKPMFFTTEMIKLKILNFASNSTCSISIPYLAFTVTDAGEMRSLEVLEFIS